MSENIDRKIEKIKKKRIKKILYMGIIFLAIIISTYTSNKVVNNINKDETIRINNIYSSISKKFSFLNMTIYDLKTNNLFENYFLSDDSNKNKQYKKAKLFEEIRKRNTVYGSMGCSLSVGSKKEKDILTFEGVKNKEEYLESIGMPKDFERYNKFIVKKNNKINIFLKDKKNYTENEIYWFISLNENDFFSEIKMELNNWYISNRDEIINLGRENSEKFKKVSSKRVKMFYIPYFYEKIFYIQPKIKITSIFLYELFKTSLVIIFFYLLFNVGNYFIIKPIKELARKMGYIKNKNEKEFEYIEHKIEEIENINQNLENKISSLKVYQRKKKIKDFLIGISEHADISLLEKESEIFKVEKYRVMIMEIYDIESIENIFDKFNMSKDLILKYFSEEVKCEIIDIDYKSIAFIMEDILTTEELKEVLKCLVIHIERNFGLKFTVAVTDIYNEINIMPKAYRAAKKVLDYKYVFKQESVIFQEMINKNNFDKYYYPIELETKLISRTLGFNEASAKKVIDEIFDEKNSGSMDKKYVKDFGILLYNTMGRIFIQLKDIDENIDIKDFKINEILKASNAIELKEIFLSKILRICKLVKIDEEYDLERIKIQIERYLEDNYMFDISLENLADYLGYSFKYASVLFKKVLGDNFKNYISIYRIEKAKEIMRENKDLRIKDLAKLIGYNSSNTFIRIFKQYEGVSPGKYFGIIE